MVEESETIKFHRHREKGIGEKNGIPRVETSEKSIRVQESTFTGRTIRGRKRITTWCWNETPRSGIEERRGNAAFTRSERGDSNSLGEKDNIL